VPIDRCYELVGALRMVWPWVMQEIVWVRHQRGWGAYPTAAHRVCCTNSTPTNQAEAKENTQDPAEP